MPGNKAPQTIAAANGIGTDTAFGAVAPPIHLSSTYTFEGFDRARAFVVAPHDCYAGIRRLLEARRAKRQLEVAFVD